MSESADGRLKNFNEYEIQKYMQKDVKPIHLPDMPTYPFLWVPRPTSTACHPCIWAYSSIHI